MENVLFAFLLTTAAGLSTGIGSAIAFFAKKTNTKFLAIALGFSAGVMIYVSMIEIFPKAVSALAEDFGARQATAITVLAFFAGMFIIGLIDRLIPSEKNPHEIKTIDKPLAEEEVCPVADAPAGCKPQTLLRTGIFTALALAIHNFPEGLATFVSALQAPSIAIPIVIAIAIHNIPEGIAVSVPIYYATGSKKKAFFYSFMSGLAEPLGAVIGYLVLMPFLSGTLFGVLFAAVAGIMVFISLDELLPAAREYGEHHLSIYGLVAGMALMAVSLILFM